VRRCSVCGGPYYVDCMTCSENEIRRIKRSSARELLAVDIFFLGYFAAWIALAASVTP
jgi:predicted nucleic acid-binding Zn ribbon protein